MHPGAIIDVVVFSLVIVGVLVLAMWGAVALYHHQLKNPGSTPRQLLIWLCIILLWTFVFGVGSCFALVLCSPMNMR